MIRGSLHVLDTGAENFYVIFASEVGTGSHLVSGEPELNISLLKPFAVKGRP
jgi:hypothetical protein